uniref:C2 domain-containing protein n=1 Tax=Odontella aurita TaxID=265563 RepID=A0A7S4HVZ5_9STRA
MASALPVVKLQLSLHASGLPRSGAVRTPPDAFAQVAIIPSQYATGEQPIHLGSTEITKRSPNPQWAKVFVIEYEYGTQLSFFVDVLTSKGDNSKSIGGANFEVGDILGSKNKTKAKRLRKGGCIFAHIEQSTSEGSDGMISFQLSALRLECKGGLMRADPSTFFEVSRQTQTSFGNKWNVIYRSNPVIESLKPTWDRAEVDLETFCNCDLDRAILISVYIFRKRGNHSLLGSFETTPNCLIEKGKKGSEREWHESTYNLQKDEYKAYEEAGCIAVMEGSIVIDGKENSVEIMPLVDQEQVFEAEVAVNGSEDQQEDEEKDIPGTSIISLASLQLDRSSIGTVLELQASKAMPTFTAYVDSGLDIDLCVALDFTSSNGDPRIPGTLHHNSDGALNDYEETILSVGGAIAKYSLDKKFPVWGFGARYGGEVRHIFQCGQSSPVYDVDGILDAYRSVFQTDLTMSGPTVISKVIQAAAARANRCHVRRTPSYCVPRFWHACHFSSNCILVFFTLIQNRECRRPKQNCDTASFSSSLMEF